MPLPARLDAVRITKVPLSPKQEKYLLLTLMGLQFTHIVDFMIMMPLGPQLTSLWHMSTTQFAWLVSTYTFSAGFSSLFAAFYVDRFERKRLLLVLYAGFAVATAFCGLCHSYEQLLWARIACGSFGGLLTALSQTIVSDVIPFHRRGSAMAQVMRAFALATVVGVPSALFVAQLGGWPLPFLLLGLLSGVLMGIAMYTLPVLRSHLEPVMTPLVASSHESALMATTLPSDNVMTRMHRLFSWFKTSQIGYAFGFSALLMLTGFTVIPFITLYLQHNAAMSAQTIPWLYFFGGIATFVTSPRIGQWADRAGKRYVFRYLSLAAMLPLLGVTVCADLPTWGILLLTTAFFVLVNGRMAPGMALLSAAVSPKARGRFLSLNASVQSMALGVATWLGGLLITHLPQGTLIGYWRAGLLACVSSAGCIWLLRNLPTHVSNVRNQTNES